MSCRIKRGDLSAPFPTYAAEIGGLSEKAVDISANSGYNELAKEMLAQSVVHLTRNEKVACSSQVTSSRKTPGFLVKPGVFITF